LTPPAGGAGFGAQPQEHARMRVEIDTNADSPVLVLHPRGLIVRIEEEVSKADVVDQTR
jgi:hypothetical protein